MSRRRAARGCFAVAVVGATLAVLPSVAGAAGQAPGVYDGRASAAGVQYTMDSDPPLFPAVSGVFDIRTPAGISTMDSGSRADAEATLVYPGAAAQALALMCLAGFPCAQVNDVTNPLGQPYPPDYPLAAQASVPGDGKPHTATADGREVGGADQPFDISTAYAEAQATPTDVHTRTVVHSISLNQGLPAALSNGASRALTRQYVDGDRFVTKATSMVSDIDLAGLVHIGSVETAAVVSNDGRGHVTSTAKVQLEGVTALGHAATIDRNGISIDHTGDGNQLAKALNRQLQSALHDHGLSVRLIGADRHPMDHGYGIDATGLLVSWRHKVSGLPDPSGLGLCIPTPDNCVASPPNPNASYFGTAIYGDASVSNLAAPTPTFDTGAATVTPSSSGPGSRTEFVPGTPGTPGTAGPVGSTSGTSAPPPQVSARPGWARIELLAGTAARLGWLFGAFLAAGVGVVLSRRPGNTGRFPIAKRTT